MKTCYFTGLRPHEFPFDHMDESAHAHILYTDALYQKAEELVRRGYTTFITGLSPGAELDFACAVIYHKDKTFRDVLNITLEGVVSASQQKSEWSDKYFKQYDYVLSSCDRKTVEPSAYSSDNKYAEHKIDYADLIFAVWNGEETGKTWDIIRYARQKGKPVELLKPDNFLK